MDVRAANGWKPRALDWPEELLLLADFSLACRVLDLYEPTPLPRKG